MYSSVITAVSELFTKFFELKRTQIENQSQTEIIEEKTDYKKATNIAEKIIDIAEKYTKYMTFAHRLRFVHLVQTFKKYN